MTRQNDAAELFALMAAYENKVRHTDKKLEPGLELLRQAIAAIEPIAYPERHKKQLRAS
jgi:hypothetical protein